MRLGNFEFDETLQQIREGALDKIQSNELSDLSSEKAARFWETVHALPHETQEKLFNRLVEFHEENDIVDYSALALNGLDELNPNLRHDSLLLLSENRKTAFLEKLIWMASEDPNQRVKLQAIYLLGQFVLDAETNDRLKSKGEKARETLFALKNSPDRLVQLQVMEALSYMDDPTLSDLIRSALLSEDPIAICSGLRAIQNTLNPDWLDNVIDFADHHNPDIQAEAIRALGVLQSPRGRGHVLNLLARFSDLDAEVLDAAILAASQLGGDEAEKMISILSRIFEEDDEMNELFEEAKENLDFVTFQRQTLRDAQFDDGDWDEFAETDYLDLLFEHIEALPKERLGGYDEEDEDEADDENQWEDMVQKYPELAEYADLDWEKFHIIDKLDEALDDDDLDEILKK